ncbi:MAG TPA: hypothetical protein VFJ43_06840 [Bacteroidia bacterium]|nr:hypothetical protein [Bacteroidia bacterium]
MLHYFGTNLATYGHYFWLLREDAMEGGPGIYLKLPFDPYDGKKLKKGEIKFFIIDGYTVLIIGGSCLDERPGCVSTFFIYKEMTFEEMKKLIISTPIAKRIIEQMPFEIKWPDNKKEF